MTTIKRIGVVGLLVAAAVLGVPGMASADVRLSPSPDGAFPKASGAVSTFAVGPYFEEFNNKYYDQYFVCKVSGLAPTTSYYFVVYDRFSGRAIDVVNFSTDGRGRGTTTPVFFGESPTANAGKLLFYWFAVHDAATGAPVLISD